tara:strand:+ start:10887 stop:11543 length:657 start_codon:yes stop_codon:yes gene_type:complete
MRLQSIIRPTIVIFDLDGVLVDACEWHRIALNKALKQVSGYIIGEKEHIEKYNGLPTATKLKMLNLEGRVRPEDNPQIHNLKQEFTIDLIQENIVIDSGKINLLKWLKSRGCKVACCTNSIRKTTNFMLTGSGIKDFFDIIISNEDVNNPKPDPEGYIKIIENYNFLPNDCMIVEDSLKGIAAANASGAKVMRVRNAIQVNKDSLERFIDENFNTDGG